MRAHWLLAALMAIAPASAMASTLAPSCPAAAVQSVRGDVWAEDAQGHRISLHMGQILEGVVRIGSNLDAGAHLELGEGVRLYLGPTTKVRLAPGTAPVIFETGELIVENRTGQDGGPPFRVAVSLGEIIVGPDSRVLIYNSPMPQGKDRALLKVLPEKGLALLKRPDGDEAVLPAGEWLYAVDWLPAEKWTREKADPGEARRIHERLFTLSDLSLSDRLPRMLPPEELTVNGVPLEPARDILLTRADLVDGYITWGGLYRRDRIPPGDWYPAITLDDGREWIKLTDTNAEGRFRFQRTPQIASDFKVAVALFRLVDDSLIEKTPTYTVRFLEQLRVALDEVVLGDRDFPRGTGTYELYSNELVESDVVLAGKVSTDAHLGRIELEATADGGVFWKPVLIEITGTGTSGTWRVEFPPVPDARFRFRMRAFYAHGSEVVEDHQVLGSWDAPVTVHYNDRRGAEKVDELMGALQEALRSGNKTALTALLSTRFNLDRRDLGEASGTRIVSYEVAPQSDRVFVSFTWVRETGTGTFGGEGMMIFGKDLDWKLFEVTGADPFRVPAPRLLKKLAGRLTLESPDLRTVSIASQEVVDFGTGEVSPYDGRRIPTDLGLILDTSGTGSRLMLTTHDRRLAPLGILPLSELDSFSRPDRPAFASSAQPLPGSTWLLRTRGGRDVLLEVLGTEGTSRVRLRYLLLPP